MSKLSRRTGAAAEDQAERWRPRIAALLTALLHLLLLLLVMLSPPITMTQPQGGDAGSRMEVTYIDQTLEPPPPVQEPAPRKAPARKPRKAAPAASRVQTTPVAQADDPESLRVVDIPDNPTTAPATELPQPPDEPASAPPDAPKVPRKRPDLAWGQPPGMLPQASAPVNAGPARSRAANRGRNHDAPTSGTSMEVGGYQVYYGLVDETRLRAWRDQGMTELFIPLPGTRRYMVCPLEVALRRESSECRMVEPDAPELKAIGDARDVITMERLYRLGEVLWRGPGAYR
ncbi:MAG: type II toxin-antitoxin system RelE/ParE family toxin [Luteimonas sp.]|nr:type II toxin-antitoxin system RelE/ParE family toxin [Luteimonas sp.]